MAPPTPTSSRPTEAAQAVVKLRVVESAVPELIGRELELAAAAVFAGRSEECEFYLADKSMSRKHARIQWTARGIEVFDMGSANGIQVAGERVTEAILGAGGRFRLGQTTIEVLVETPRPAVSALVPGSETVLMPATSAPEPAPVPVAAVEVVPTAQPTAAPAPASGPAARNRRSGRG
jgi:S-DNA-T family DNA segregation ATPase FtsK/SpoIIIE